MSIPVSRRAVVRLLALGALGSSTLWAASTTTAPVQTTITAEQIADSLTMFSGAGGNVLVHEGPDNIVLVDGGSPEHSPALLSAIHERFGGKPVSAIINTHWHLEQTGSNDTLGLKDTPIIAHENTRRWMTTRIEQTWEGRVFEPRAKIALPTQTFYIGNQLDHGDEIIRLVHTPRAHTDGDIHAIFPKANVIAAGGIAYSGSYPVLDTATNGWIGEMLDATRTLLANTDDETIIVPSDGSPLKRKDLVEQEAMLATIFERFQTLSKQGKGADDMLKEGIAQEYLEEWGDPTNFIYTAWDGLWDHMRGLRAF